MVELLNTCADTVGDPVKGSMRWSVEASAVFCAVNLEGIGEVRWDIAWLSLPRSDRDVNWAEFWFVLNGSDWRRSLMLMCLAWCVRRQNCQSKTKTIAEAWEFEEFVSRWKLNDFRQFSPHSKKSNENRTGKLRNKHLKVDRKMWKSWTRSGNI